ncbi:MAG TPA: 4Fe-4S dicluster domain-containing protein [Anaerolineae bacterium]|nr:4Fe-4S dicluster domain-containing protein [Anaerolineae bacterium]
MEYYPHIVCDPEKCVGCRMCELACSMTKEGVFAPLLSRIRNVRIEPIVQMTISCRLCQDPPCVIACPRDALSQSAETGIIIVDEDLCDGCGWCIEACPFGAIALYPAKKVVVICDLCQDLEEPQCVKYCPKEALSLSTTEMVAQKARKEAVTKLLEELVAG